MNRAAFDARLSEALAAGDGLTRIIRAWRVRERGSAECGRVEVWSQKAMEELEVVGC